MLHETYADPFISSAAANARGQGSNCEAIRNGTGVIVSDCLQQKPVKKV